MKRILAALLVLVMALGLTACGGAKLTMGTGGTQGTYYAYGGVLGQHIKDKTGVAVNVVSTEGSAANIQGIAAGDYTMATVQSDVMSYAWDGTRAFEKDGKVDSFRVIAGLYGEAVQLISMNPEIKTVADLKGKSVSIGAANSGVYFNAIDVLNAAGMTEEDIKAQFLSFDESTDAMKDGKIDAAFIVAGAPTTAITDLCLTNDAHLIPIDGKVAETMMNSNPFYTTYKVPAGTYKGQDEDVTTVTVKATLIVSADVSEDTVYEVTKAIFEDIEGIEHAKAAELSLENATSGMTVPFHKGAAKYFAEKDITVDAK